MSRSSPSLSHSLALSTSTTFAPSQATRTMSATREADGSSVVEGNAAREYCVGAIVLVDVKVRALCDLTRSALRRLRVPPPAPFHQPSLPPSRRPITSVPSISPLGPPSPPSEAPLFRRRAALRSVTSLRPVAHLLRPSSPDVAPSAVRHPPQPTLESRCPRAVHNPPSRRYGGHHMCSAFLERIATRPGASNASSSSFSSVIPGTAILGFHRRHEDRPLRFRVKRKGAGILTVEACCAAEATSRGSARCPPLTLDDTHLPTADSQSCRLRVGGYVQTDAHARGGRRLAPPISGSSRHSHSIGALSALGRATRRRRHLAAPPRGICLGRVAPIHLRQTCVSLRTHATAWVVSFSADASRRWAACHEVARRLGGQQRLRGRSGTQTSLRRVQKDTAEIPGRVVPSRAENLECEVHS
ncbi:hypothetical protein HYPSUDRAFT_208771 [Hypholoma sublateritium FD-334 SS-4]|uniref:Uncharacterized protein n=1 Tax=Hypholoma sublateritium (strain FD-334 SS-4) TaxID=945553 RepID=A0A0D2P131_HYPSF|nr:hypothetical protein HYPSUDRAFT_208771 [Hypholoma sublateritium FD-334 SS-4]